MFFKKQKFVKIIFGLLSLVLFFNVLSVFPVSASEVPTDFTGISYATSTGLGGGDIRTTIAKIIQSALGLLGIVALVIILYGGYVYMTAGGNEEKVATAKKVIFNGVIGLAIILSAYAIVSFVANKLLEATKPYPNHCYDTICNEDEDCADPGGTETRINCGGSCSACKINNNNTLVNSFYIRKLPSGGQKCVTNLKPSIIFSQKVDFNSLSVGQNWKINVYKFDNTLVPGRWDLDTDGLKISFIPEADCSGVCDDNCFSPSTAYVVKITNPVNDPIKSKKEYKLNCSVLGSSVGCGDVEFITGEVCDATPPTVEITHPEDGGAFNSGGMVEVQVSSTDNIAVNYIELIADNDSNAVSIMEFDGCQTSVNTTTYWYPDYVTRNTEVELKAISHDQADLTGEFIRSVQLKPTHCFNEEVDLAGDVDLDLAQGEAPETDVDCGGECGSCGGDVCTLNKECRSGFCYIVPPAEGICLDKARINKVDPLSGALGTFVSISGYYFGQEIGDVYFASTTSAIVDGPDWIKASLADCAGDTDVWTPWQVIVESPLKDGQIGPIKIIASSTSYTGDIPEEHRTDLTNDIWGVEIDDFEATDDIRPGLCSLTQSTGTQKMPLDLNGVRFGDERGDSSQNYVYFGAPGDGKNGKAKVQVYGTAPFGSIWNDTDIKVEVPGIGKGKVGVQVFNDNIKSNTVAFRMMEEVDETLPNIGNITPDSGAIGEYITISGRNFGSFETGQSKVLFTEDGTNNSFEGSFDFPAECQSGDLWNDNQIIVKFPNVGYKENPTNYLVQVVRSGDGKQSQLGMYFNLDSDVAGPGVCKIDPMSAPLPFLDGNFTTLYGENFSDLETDTSTLGVYYFNNADIIPTSIDWRLPATGTLAFVNGTSTLTGAIPPYFEDEATFEVIDITTVNSGPVVVSKDIGGGEYLVSNPINFEVLDCKANNDICTQTEYQCCGIKDNKGEDTGKGFCIPSGDMCPGSTRSSGYTWRFSTKDIPPVPRVVENCYYGVGLPSPAPSIRWNEKSYETDHVNVCRQALVTVEFSMFMASTTFTDDNIIVRECSDMPSEDDLDRNYNGCPTPGAVLDLKDSFGNTGTPSDHFETEPNSESREYLELYPDGGWATSTWYQVILTKDIMSGGYGSDITIDNKTNLVPSRPCGVRDENGNWYVDGITSPTAYCFIFKTGTEDCKLSGISVLPDNYWTQILEEPILHRNMFGENDLYWKGTGKTQQKCINMDVKGYDWEWRVDYVTVTTTPIISSTQVEVIDGGVDEYSNISRENQNFDIKKHVDARGYTSAVGLADIYGPITTEDIGGVPVSSIQYVDNVYVYAKASTGTVAEGNKVSHFDWSPLTIGAGDPEVVEFWPDCLEACTNAEVGVRFNTTMSDKNVSSGFPIRLEECLDENCFGVVTATNTIMVGGVEEPGGDIKESHEFEASKYTVLKIANYNNNTVNLKPNTLYKVTLSVTSTEAEVGTDPRILWSAAKIDLRQSTAKPFNEEFSWRFRTKANNCLVDRVEVTPASYVAKSLNDKTIYEAQPYSEPDSCSSKGQRLNPWSNVWNWWSVNTSVATTSQYSVIQSSNYCTDKCVLKGSDIPASVAQTIIPICGNGVVEAGEDCDEPNKLMGCGLNCLYTGEFNSETNLVEGTCGDGTVNTTSTLVLIAGVYETIIYGEECDWASTSDLIRHGCTRSCLKEGSKMVTEAEDVEGSICGNGMLGAGEECELGITASSTDKTSSLGCNQNCLHIGTRISKRWCSDHKKGTDDEYGGFVSSTYNNACRMSYSQCGDGVRSLDEDVGCDGYDADDNPGSWAIGGDCREETGNCDCDVFCLKITPECSIGSEGCSKNGRLLGSGLRYSTPSLCGDGFLGIGEYADCETDAYKTITYLDARVGPWALVTAQSSDTGSIELVQYASTTIKAEALGGDVKNGIQTGNADFLIPCGFESDDACQDYFGPNSGDPKYGVGTNSCCYVRPNLTEKYPRDNAYDICPNTVIKATFDQKINEDSLRNNVILAYGLTDSELKEVTPDDPFLIANFEEVKTSQISISGNYLYSIIDGNTIEIHDISNKKSPVLLSSTTTARVFNDIYIKNGFLFLSGNDILEIWDVYDSKKIKVVYSLDRTSSGMQIKINGNYLYLLDDDGVLNIWKIESINNLIPISTTTIATDSNINFYVNGDYFYTTKSDSGVDVYPINNLLSGSNSVPLTKEGDLTGSVSDIDIIGDDLYVLEGDKYKVYKIDFKEVGGINTFSASSTSAGYNLNSITGLTKLKVNDDYVYIASENEVYVLNISNSLSPTTTWDVGGLEYPELEVFSNDELVYIFNRGAGTDNYLGVYDISAYFKSACERDVTSLVQLAQADSVNIPWYKNVWNRIARFFKDLFGFKAMAVSTLPRDPIVKWCAGDEVEKTSVLNFANTSTSKIVIDLKKPLKADTDYAVILNSSITDVRGVGIGQNQNNSDFKINWKFVTDNKPICEIDKTEIIPKDHELVFPDNIVGVESTINPSEVFFTKTQVTTTLEAVVHSDNNQEIQSVDGYNWNYIWEPIKSDYVMISSTTDALNEIQAHNQNGEGEVLATANILVPNDYPPYNIGRTGETGTAHIIVFLCENPWPPFGANRFNSTTERIFPYEDIEGNNDAFDFNFGSGGQFTGDVLAPAVEGGYFNFKFYYCADNGMPGEEDDLPYLKPVVQPGRPTSYLNTDLNHDLNTDLSFFKKTKIWLRSLVVTDVYAADCVDADGEDPNPYLVKGAVTDSIYTDGREDSCLGDYWLKEGTCFEDSLKGESIDCRVYYGGNYRCEDGACVTDVYVADCIDTDRSELNPYLIKGAVIVIDGADVNEVKDACINPLILKEGICSDDVYEFEEINCRDYGSVYACKDGVCFSQSGYCGDSFVQSPNGADVNEVCDKNNFNSQTCQTILGDEYDNTVEGLECSEDCLIIDSSGCIKKPVCGNNSLEKDEVCDGLSLNGQNCASFYDPNGDLFAGGDLSCSSDCLSFNTSSCYYCGDDVCNVESETYQNCNLDCDPPGLIGKALKRFIFTAEGSGDAIGIQVFDNPKHLTVSEWHQTNTDSGQLQMQSLVVDGYDAVTDGNNIYIDALNYTGVKLEDGTFTTGTMFSNIYLFSRNLGASPETLNIFEQIITNVEFNANLTNYGYCGSDVLNPEYVTTCFTDIDCDVGKVCSNQKDKLKRNYARLRDLQEMKENLDEYSKRTHPDVIAYWNFDKLYTDEQGNGYAVDLVHKNHAKCGDGGCPTIVSSTAHRSIDTSGDKYLSVKDQGENDVFDFDGNSEFTILGWVKRTGDTGNKPFQAIVSKGKGTTLNWALGISQDNGGDTSRDVLQFINYTNGKWRGFYATNNDGEFILNDGEWDFVGIVLTQDDENNKGLKYFLNDKVSNVITESFDGKVNGEGVYTTSSLDKYPLLPNDEELRIGTSHIGSRKFNGVISDLIIYKRALSDEEVKSHYFNYPDFSDSYPSMSEGSYLTGQTLSVWDQSWSKLGSGIGASLPIDPINKLGLAGSCLFKSSDSSLDGKWVFCQSDIDCNDVDADTGVGDYSRCTYHDPVTGWSAEDRRFSFACDNLRSYAYRYIYQPNNSLGYKIKTKFEDEGLDDWDINNKQDFLNAFIDPVRMYMSNVCNPAGAQNELSSMSTGFCGDGKLNLNLGEVCDPPNGTQTYKTDPECGGDNQYKLRLCSNDCSEWLESDVETCTEPSTPGCAENSLTVCYNRSLESCGNGIVESWEVCDDGALNGQYNHCDSGCLGFITACTDADNDNICDSFNGDPGYCGDEFVNSLYELCDINKDLDGHKGFCVFGFNNGLTCDDDTDCDQYCKGVIDGNGDCVPLPRPEDLSSGPDQQAPGGEVPLTEQDAWSVFNDLGDYEFSEQLDNHIGIVGGMNTEEDAVNEARCIIIDEHQERYSSNKEDSCAWDCQSDGPYCGDGIIQGMYGETCDGDVIMVDGEGNRCKKRCSDTCRMQNETDGAKKPVLNISPIDLKLTGADSALHDYDGDSVNFNAMWKMYWEALRDDMGANGRIYSKVVHLSIILSAIADVMYPDVDVSYLNKFCDDLSGGYSGCIMLGDAVLNNLVTVYPGETWDCESIDPITPPVVTSEQICGNGEIDASNDEICDRGELNGRLCEIEEGENYCTYCSWDCKEIIDVYEIATYDQGRNCGDGILQEAFEVCDDYKHVDGQSNPTCNSDCQSICGNGKVEIGDDPASPNEFCDPLDPLTRGGCNAETCHYERCEMLRDNTPNSLLTPVEYIDCNSKPYRLGYCGDGELQNEFFGIKFEKHCDIEGQDLSFDSIWEEHMMEECIEYSGFGELCNDCEKDGTSCKICSDGTQRFGGVEECRYSSNGWDVEDARPSLCGSEYAECNPNGEHCNQEIVDCKICKATYGAENTLRDDIFDLSNSRCINCKEGGCNICTKKCRFFENVPANGHANNYFTQ